MKPVKEAYVKSILVHPLMKFCYVWEVIVNMCMLPTLIIVFHFFYDDMELWMKVLAILFYVMFNLPLVMIFVAVISRKSTWKNEKYSFANNCYSITSGLWTTTTSHIPMQSVLDVHVQKNIFDKKYGTGTLVINTASGSHYMYNILNPEDYVKL